jgi:hypothetical protein
MGKQGYELVKKLRQVADECASPEREKLMRSSAEEITRLRSDNARLRDALKPFAAHAGLFGPDDATCEIEVSFGALRMALSAITSTPCPVT